jgi:hypothetical protein
MAENWGTWAFREGANPVEFLTEVHNLMAEVDLVGSKAVRHAIGHYVGDLEKAMETMPTDPDENASVEERAAMAGLAYGQAMAEARERVIQAMRRDIGYSR